MNGQIGLFDRNPSPATSVSLPLPDGDVLFFESFFSAAESDAFFSILKTEVSWRQEKINLYGREIDIPRLTAWYGDPGRSYKYSGITNKALPWTPTLKTIKDRIESASGAKFNSVLLNLYRTGSDGVSWHSDDEPELGTEPTIGSVSFGETRTFQLKHRIRENFERVNIELRHGSFLIMRGPTQRYWLHQIPKTKKTLSPRINLTFRTILPS